MQRFRISGVLKEPNYPVPYAIGKLPETLLHTVKADDPFSIGDLEIHPFTISHDAAEPVGYRISHNGRCCAVATDMGCYDEYMVKELTGLDVLLLESNHDVHMLEAGRYGGIFPTRRPADCCHACFTTGSARSIWDI